MELRNTTTSNKRKIKYTSDWTLWACYIILCGISVVEVFSASSYYLKQGSVYLPITQHIQWLALGFVMMFIIEHIHYKYSKGVMPFLGGIAIILAILTPFIGETSNDAARSIDLGIVSVQAAEPCKLASALMLAYFLSRFQNPDGSGLSKKGVYWGLGIIFMFVALLVTQGGSNALLIMLVGCTMMMLAVLPRKLAIIVYSAAAVIIIAAVVFFVSYNINLKNHPKETEAVVETTIETSLEEKEEKSVFGQFIDKYFRSETWERRIKDWLPDGEPEYTKDTTDDNSQEHHAYMAIAHGNGVGVMPGNSRECSRLQLAYSDYIYAIILEELGILGGVIVLLCYLGIVIRACMISKKCKNAYASLLIMGMSLVIVYQAFYHMCISVGVLPVSGQPLPFISRGGTSIVIMSIAMGIMLSVSRYAVERTPSGLKTIVDDDELPDDLKAENPARGF